MDAAQVIEPAHAGQDVDEAAVAARELSGAERALVGDLVRQARAEGVALTGPDGLLKALTKTVLEAALQEEMTEHLATTGTPQPGVEVETHATDLVTRR